MNHDIHSRTERDEQRSVRTELPQINPRTAPIQCLRIARSADAGMDADGRMDGIDAGPTAVAPAARTAAA